MIEVRSLTKVYGDRVAVDDLSFDVRPGIVTGFLGPNGAGKSTTMRMIVDLDHPTSGSVTVNGKRYRDHASPLHEVGALLEAKAVHTGRTARNHLLALAATSGISRRRVDEVVDLVGLHEVAGKRAGGFSLGMGQRLGIASALLGDPQTLILDEPVNGLDPDGVLWIRNLLKDLAAEGRTVLVSSHLMSEMALTAEHLVVVGRGRLIADSPTAQLVEEASGSSVVVRSPDLDRLEPALRVAFPAAEVSFEADLLRVRGLSTDEVGEVAFREGVLLHELAGRTASLEDAFMELTQDSVEYHGTGKPRSAGASS